MRETNPYIARKGDSTVKKLFALILAASLMTLSAAAIHKPEESDIVIDVPSAILMEKTTGEVIYEKNSHERMEPASVTKVMTMLIVIEEIEKGNLSLDDMVTGSARASSMGGSQIWLEDGEQLSVHDMLKCVAVVSANDCAVALAEHIAGSEEAFVARMNKRAKELGMEDTNFTNCTGLLESKEHYTSAYDIALMSRELIQHDMIKEYTTIWMDYIRDGTSLLTSTNKLIYYYSGATGLKTGFTSGAMYCLSATAERDGVEYIAVVMHGETSDKRFESAKVLLNYAFANYSLAQLAPAEALPPVYVELGEYNSVQPMCQGAATALVDKGDASKLEYSIELCESVKAPVEEGQVLGSVTVSSGGEVLATLPLAASSAVGRLNGWDILCSLLRLLTGGE